MSKPKFSIVMSYHNRDDLLRTTLESYSFYYEDIKDEIEIVIVDDSSDDTGALASVLKDFDFKFQTSYIDRKRKYPRNPCVPYNIAARLATGDFLNLTNPENAHMGPILKDAKGRVSAGKYVVYACLNLKGKPGNYAELKGHLGVYVEPDPSASWYQHSRYNNRLLHFCTFIKREDFIRIGGFDEVLSDGSGYDDNDLIQTVVKNDLKVEAVDSLYCAHQPHSRNWDQESTFKNLGVMREKWGFLPIDKWKVGKEKEQLDEARSKSSGAFLFKV